MKIRIIGFCFGYFILGWIVTGLIRGDIPRQIAWNNLNKEKVQIWQNFLSSEHPSMRTFDKENTHYSPINITPVDLSGGE